MNKSLSELNDRQLQNSLTLLIEPQTISDRIHLYLKIDAIALQCPPILNTSTTNRQTIKEKQ
ncbi:MULTISPECIES: hypothetical protein [Microcoleaceae]|uniref:hypothetical protein n=1 Tax=Microcoleaceae TaxID=1892252 RepID=UPI00188282C4|nr:hypothetical protein [Tychonema sp. LEGE 06208]MBE9163387.1 hypothetical protein [Tychonema sp. LEGE 06208]